MHSSRVSRANFADTRGVATLRTPDVPSTCALVLNQRSTEAASRCDCTLQSSSAVHCSFTIKTKSKVFICEYVLSIYTVSYFNDLGLRWVCQWRGLPCKRRQSLAAVCVHRRRCGVCCQNKCWRSSTHAPPSHWHRPMIIDDGRWSLKIIRTVGWRI